MRSVQLRRVTATVVASTLAVGAPALATAGGRSHTATPAPVLPATVVLAGNHSGVIAVTLPRAVKFRTEGSGGRPSDVAIAGQGRFYGALMRRDGGRQLTGGFSAVAASACIRPGCASPRGSGSFGDWVYPAPTNGTGTEGTLPAGQYHLYLIADGDQVRVKLHFEGLRPGRLVLQPHQPAPVQFVTAPVDSSVPAAGSPGGIQASVYSAGSTHTVRRLGGAFIAFAWKWEPAPDEVNAVNFCGWAGSPPEPDATGYRYQGCATPYLAGSLQSSRTTGPLGALAQYQFQFITMSALELKTGQTSPLTIGGYVDTTGPVLEAHVTMLWVDWVGARQA